MVVARDRAGDRSRELCAVLGHELRNPLASAVTHISVAAALMDAGDPRAEHLQGALGDLERLSTLLSTYLEFGRGAGRGVGSSSARPVDVVDVVRAVISRNSCTRVEFDESSVMVKGDPELLGRALENIIENAFQVGASEVSIRVSRRDGAAVIDVSDDGPGVALEMRDTLFDAFVSGRKSSGLGLAVARDVVEGQGGRITLLDAKRGCGAVFEIILPCVESAASVLTF